MKQLTTYLIIILLFSAIGWFGNDFYRSTLKTSPNPVSIIKQRPLERYAIENLMANKAPSVEIKREKVIEENDDFTSYLISFSFDPTFSGKTEKKVTGLMNVPKLEKQMPLIILFRGYVDQKIYQTGIGTQRVGEFFAKNGFITIAPDFLGYADSDSEAENIFESRFQTYTTALTVINSVSSIKEWDDKNVFLWGHSNGGQIAITALEQSGVDYPTVLWAAVTKPFPYSILYYTDESDDHGKLIRRELSKFEEDYDVEKFSLTNYLDRIKAPIQFHQGTNDDAVPVTWSNEFTKKLESLDVDVDYIVHPGVDHNMQPSWQLAVNQSLQFYKNHLK